MAIPVARVHLAMAHAALPALLPTPPKWKMLPLLPTPPPCVVTAILQAKPPLLAKPSRRADSDERWDARKTKPPTSAEPSSASASSGARSADSLVIRSSTGHGSPRKNTTSPPPKPGRADSVERWDAHKMAASPASPPPPPPPSSSSGKWTISHAHASSAERWDVHKKCCPTQAELLDDGESSSTGSNDIEDMEEEILWKPRAMYAGPGFVVAAPESSMLPMPTAFLVPVA
ncbi:hypothetical protein BDA96_05G043000 [Sorghum bicolor]|uniref:Uncharacterized protein n=2 Tax=Sorghum bicolor TaxID=4558 RepID=A0A921UEK3_SORBI|nr:proline-rich receptor-like protein kinase PERK14 [Sorghum bicolor]EES09286.1 hypothetical protein SORBI_3005G040800 [Sorghum bicolor]KAG0528789.1 hypothetical protein BDA96_05G043000 [Sorghum bicolor]|eukprot:XP_002450298.1 proline-rich receptor-like protein kinase PERK14 [Sorghum bicolor]